MEEKNKFLRKSFLPIDKKNEILKLGKERFVKKNTVLVESDSFCDKIFYLSKGAFLLRFIDDDKDIKKVVSFFYAENNVLITCWDAYFSESSTKCELVAVANSIVIEYKKTDIEQMIKNDIEISNIYNDLICNVLHEEISLKIKLNVLSKKELYLYLTSHYPGIIDFFPVKYIAEFMGITPEWLYKIRKLNKII